MIEPNVPPGPRLTPERALQRLPSARPTDTTSESGVVRLDPRRLIDALRRHVRLVLLMAALGTGIAALLVLSATPRYAAWALVRLRDARTPLIQGVVDPADAGVRPLTDPVLSEIHVLTSRSLASQVVDHVDAVALRAHPVGFPRSLLQGLAVERTDAVDSLRLRFEADGFSVIGRDGERRAPYGTSVGLDGVRFTVTAAPGVPDGLLVVIPTAKAVDSLLANLSVRPRARTDLLDVGYAAADPEVAASVVNATVQVYQTASMEVAQQRARRRRVFMEEQLRQNDSILYVAQRALSDLRGRNRSYSAQEMFAVGQQGLAGLDVQRVNLELERQTHQGLLADLTRGDAAAAEQTMRVSMLSSGAAANPVVAQLYAQLLRQQAAYDSLSTGEWRSAEGSPDLQRLQALIASSRAQLVSAVRSYVGSLDARIGVLDGLKAARSAAFQQLPAAEVEESRLAMQLDALRKVGDDLRQQYQKTRIEEAAQAGQLEIIDLATVPRGPIGVGAVTKLGLGLALGLMLGGGLAFLKDTLSTAIRRREDIETSLQLPWLAVIPRIQPAAAPGVRGRVRGGGTSRWRELRPLALFGRGEQGELTQRAIAADAFRLLQVNLAFANEAETLKSIVVTSPTAQDGKTTTAINLAVAFADQGARVLLVDCDLRRPRLHRLSRMGRAPGLSELLLGRDAPADVIRRLSGTLSLLAAGTMPPNPAALLGSTRMREVLDLLAGEYDVVVLDCPPALLGADAALVGAQADGVLFVVRAGYTEREIAQDALDQLRRVGARVLGVALNDPEAVIPRYTYDMHETYAEYYYQQMVQPAPANGAVQPSSA